METTSFRNLLERKFTPKITNSSKEERMCNINNKIHEIIKSPKRQEMTQVLNLMGRKYSKDTVNNLMKMKDQILKEAEEDAQDALINEL